MEREELKSAVGYIFNELIENALKYRDQGRIDIRLGFSSEELIFLVTNELRKHIVSEFQEWLEEISREDPKELLFRKVEKNAEMGGTSSGLGLLIIMNDYGARLGWKFAESENLDSIIVNTMARLPVGKYSGTSDGN